MRSTQFRFPVTTLAGSTLKNLSALNRNHRVEPRYRAKFLLTAGVAGLFEIFNLAERIAWQKRIREYKLASPPIFIVAFWRSGTTLLHNLLCQDPRAAYTTTFQTVFPNLFLTQSWWLKPIINHLVPANRPFDNVRMDMDFPQEEEFGLMNLQPSTLYRFFIYPGDFDRIVERELLTGSLPPDQLVRWKRKYRSMIAKAAFNTGGSRYTSKNPCNLARIPLLKSMFPDAKFIFIHRDPYRVNESLYRYILSICPGVQLQDVPPGFTREKVVKLYERLMNVYFVDRGHLPAGDLFEFSLNELISGGVGCIQKIYDHLGIDGFDRARPAMEKYIADNPRPTHPSYKPDPETIEMVNRHAALFVKELGYDPIHP